MGDYSWHDKTMRRECVWLQNRGRLGSIGVSSLAGLKLAEVFGYHILTLKYHNLKVST